MAKHIFILLDVDDTLVDYSKSTVDNIVLFGGNSHWARTLRTLRAAALKLDIHIHFGLATAKPKFIAFNNLNANQRGDCITGRLLEEKTWLEVLPEPHYKYGLKELIDPELIFFVGDPAYAARSRPEEFYNVKVKHALLPAKDILEKRLHIKLSNDDGFLIDNDIKICGAAYAAGFNIICVEELIHLNKAEQKKYITKTLLDESFIPNPKVNTSTISEVTTVETLIELGKRKNINSVPTNDTNESKEIPEIALNQNSFFHADDKNVSVDGAKKKRLNTTVTECSPDEAQRNPGFL